MKELTLRVITPAGGAEPIRCESLRLHLSDGENGKGGGSYGIRSGHVNAIFSLEEGPLTAYSGGKLILSAHCGGGFATVEKDVVTVVAETYSE